MEIKYRQLVKAVIEAQYCETLEQAEKYVIGNIQGSRFLRGSGLDITSNFRKVKNRKLLKVINAHEVRDATVNKKTGKSEITILCDDCELL